MFPATRNMLLFAGFPFLLVLTAAAAPAQGSFIDAKFDPATKGTLALKIEPKVLEKMKLTTKHPTIKPSPTSKRGVMRFEARGTRVSTADAASPPAVPQPRDLDKRQNAALTNVNLGPDQGSLFTYQGPGFVKPAMTQAIDLKAENYNPTIHNYLDVNQTLVPDIKWLDLAKDLQKGPEINHHYSLHVALNKTAEGYATGIRKIFDAGVLPPVVTPPQGEPQDYKMFPNTTSLPMTMLLYARGVDNTISYAVQASQGPTVVAQTTYKPIPLAIAVFAYIREVLTSLIEGVGRPEVPMSWTDAAAVWASIVALTNMYDVTMNMLDAQKGGGKVNYPIKAGDYVEAEVAPCMQFIESGGLYQAGTVTGQPFGSFEPYAVLKAEAEASS